MADVSKIDFGDGVQRDIKDAYVRENYVAKSQTAGLLKNDGTIDTNTYATTTQLGDKADKVTSATNGNFAGLDSNGNLTDSGSKASDFLTQHQDITGKADRVTSATSGDLAGLDSSGNLTDSGIAANNVTVNSIIAPVESGTTASQAYTVGAHFIRNGALCTVIAAIASGDTLTENTNYKSGNIAALLDYFQTTITLSTSTTTTATFANAAITTDKCVDVAVSEWGLVPESVVLSSGTCTVTFPSVESAHSVDVRIYLR